MINLIIKLLLSLSLFIFISGCMVGPSDLGMSRKTWDKYSKDKQRELLDSYARISKERVKNLNGIKGQNRCLEVSIYRGGIMFPPLFDSWSGYHPVMFNICSGECKDIKVFSGSSKTNLSAYFNGNILYLDHSHYDELKKKGSVSIYYSPLWIDGFTYKGISSSGYIRFNNVSVKIKQI